MKKLILFSFLFTLFGCVKTGNFTEDRQALHEKRNYDICNEHPERCIEGNIPW